MFFDCGGRLGAGFRTYGPVHGWGAHSEDIEPSEPPSSFSILTPSPSK